MFFCFFLHHLIYISTVHVFISTLCGSVCSAWLEKEDMLTGLDQDSDLSGTELWSEVEEKYMQDMDTNMAWRIAL